MTMRVAIVIVEIDKATTLKNAIYNQLTISIVIMIAFAIIVFNQHNHFFVFNLK